MCAHCASSQFRSGEVVEGAYERANVGELLVSGHEDRLDEELVAALGVRRRVFFHRLQEDYAHVSVCHGQTAWGCALG